MIDEMKIKIQGQWFTRGNRSPRWFAVNSLPDGSRGGLAEAIPEHYWPIFEEITDHLAEIKALKAENERLREGLRFYANPQNHTSYMGENDVSPVENDFGQIARELLKEEK